MVYVVILTVLPFSFCVLLLLFLYVLFVLLLYLVRFSFKCLVLAGEPDPGVLSLQTSSDEIRFLSFPELLYFSLVLVFAT